MRGIGYLLSGICAAALSSGVWAQDTGSKPLTPVEKAAIATRLDALEAEAKALRQLLGQDKPKTEVRKGKEWTFDTPADLARDRQLQALIAALDAQAAEAPEPSRKPLLERAKRLRDLDSDRRRYRQDWLAAVVAVHKADDEAEAAKERSERYPNAPGHPVRKTEDEAYQAKVKAANELAATVEPKYHLYLAQEKIFDENVEREFVELAKVSPTIQANVDAEISAEKKRRDTLWADLDRNPCSLETETTRRVLAPNGCRFLAEATPVKVLRSEGSISLPDRPVDRRGVTTQLTTSGDKTALTLKVAGSIKRRTFLPDEDFWQRAESISYSLGVTADVADSKGRLLGDSEKEKDLETLDRIDERTKLIGSIGYNWYDREKSGSWDARAKKLRDDAAKACREDQAAAETAYPSTCEGQQLLEWIFAADGKGGYRNPKQVEAFNAVYWGAAEKVARRGVGLTGEISLPRLEYYKFGKAMVPNPLKQGALSETIDTVNIPPEFYAGKPLKRREVSFSLGAYGFYRFGSPSPTQPALTLIPSLTYKRDFEKPGEVTICPAAAAPGATVVTTQLCKEISPSEGEIVNSLSPAIEARFYLPNKTRFLPWLLPGFGFAPKFSFEQREDENRRYAFDMPFWFGMNDEGTLTGGLAFQHQWGGRDTDGALRSKDTSLSIFVSTTFDLGSK